MTSISNDVKDNRVYEWNEDLINQLERELTTIEKTIRNELKVHEGSVHYEEEVPQTEPPVTASLLQITNRIKFALERHIRAEGRMPKDQQELREQLKDQQALYREIEMERDVLLQQVHSYLQTNSSLRVRLEEQRCQTGALQRQLNADLEARIKALENDKEKLNDLILEKDKKIHEMYLTLEQTANCLKKKETELLKLKNTENNLISSLKGDLQVALEEKSKFEEKYAHLKEQIDEYFLGKSFEGLSLKKNSYLRKSLSVGDVSCAPLNFIKTFALKFPRRSVTDSALAPQSFKLKEPGSLFGSKESLVPSSRPCINSTLTLPHTSNCFKKEKPECPEPSVHTQLNALKRGLLNVTRKLEILKCQLVSSGAIEEDPKASENSRSLKRKASLAEEVDSAILEDPRLGFNNLKRILEDAKSLNAKLQNMREKKQRIFELRSKETGFPVDTKKNNKFCQTVAHSEPPFREFQSALTELKNAMRDCEEKIDGGKIFGDEAWVSFVSALSACVLSNLKYYHEWRMRSWFSDEIDTNLLMDEGSNGSREVTSPGENGGGDNLLKKRISTDGLGGMELKIQIDRLRYKIQQVALGYNVAARQKSPHR